MLFKFDSSNRKRFVFFALSVLTGLLDYLICDFVAWINHLPLFCDTIFIMALSFLAGPWWGVLAGFFYHLIDFMLNRTLEPGHLFMLCHFLAALTAGYFKIRFIKKTDKPKTVHIVGGGIGGMEAARVLTLGGHKPILYEKSGELGGTFIAASAESYKGKLRDLLSWYRHEMEKLGVEVRLHTEVKEIESFGSDPVIIATGSTPRVLKRVPGHEKMLEACEYLLGAPVGETVAVVGGGLTGCEIAYELALQGKNVSIVEMKDDLVSQKGVCLANSSYLREWFAWKKVPVYLETTLREVKDGSIVCVGSP